MKKWLTRFVLSSLLTFGATHALQAQAKPTASGPGAYVAVGGGISAYQADYGKRILGGGMVYADIHPTWRYGLEAEARFLRYNTDEGVKQTTYLIGPQVYVLPGKIRPYGKFLVGEGKMDFPFGYAQGSYFAMAPGAGVDIVLKDRVMIRVVDVEYQMWPKFTYGSLHPYGVSAGISIRLNRLNHFPGHR